MTGLRLLRYIVRRLLQAVPVILGVTVLCFLLLQLAPGDLAEVLPASRAARRPSTSRICASATGWTSRCWCSSAST